MKSSSLLMVGLWMICGVASAAVDVQFVDPAKYRDAVPDARHGVAKETDTTLKNLRMHIEKLAGRYFPDDRMMRISILDIDLAGDIRLVNAGGMLRELRVLSSITWPTLKLRYVIEKEGKTEAQGEETLSDPNYQDHINAYDLGEPLRYEFYMLDDWFARKFARH